MKWMGAISGLALNFGSCSNKVRALGLPKTKNRVGITYGKPSTMDLLNQLLALIFGLLNSLLGNLPIWGLTGWEILLIAFPDRTGHRFPGDLFLF
jgi:hypothetical protein